MIKIKVQLLGGRGVGSTRIRIVRGYSTKIHNGKQGKHIQGHNNYVEGKSRLTIPMSEAQRLINQHAGNKKNRWITPNKEKVDFGKPIGYWFNPNTGKYEETQHGILHYSKDGVHLVPTGKDIY